MIQIIAFLLERAEVILLIFFALLFCVCALITPFLPRYQPHAVKNHRTPENDVMGQGW